VSFPRKLKSFRWELQLDSSPEDISNTETKFLNQQETMMMMRDERFLLVFYKYNSICRLFAAYNQFVAINPKFKS
jgi:hypothetical protein